MNLVCINLYGEYIENSYEETVFLLEDDYKKLGRDLDGEEIYLGALDGKLSEVYGSIEIEIINKEEQLTYRFDVNNDGKDLYYELKDINSDIDEMIERANNYIESLDRLVDV